MAFGANVIMLGVEDVERAKAFYVEGLGCAVGQDYPGFARLKMGEGSSDLALYQWDAVAGEAGLSAEGSGFRGMSLHYLVASRGEVDATIKAALAAGGSVTRPAEAAQWGGYWGYFSDPDGWLWKVATAE